MEKKKVGLFLRVSTAQQVSRDSKEVDLPTQRQACMQKINMRSDWQLYKEYIEVGSAYKNTMQERDRLLEAMADIENGVIDVFFCFMFDRIGRIASETPFIVQRMVKMGAEVWSANEGQRTFDTDTDELLNFITFWQAAGESKKTSMRVTESMTAMARQGEYIGGKPPYGYERVEVGGTTKKGLPKRSLAINEDESRVVEIIYGLASTRNYGCHRIASYLNEQDIKTRHGKQWGNASIANILRNPIYKGLKAYNRTTAKVGGGKQIRKPREQWTFPDEANPEWVIIPPDVWDEVQKMRDAVVSMQKEQQEFNQSIPDYVLGRSKLLFIGYIYCGCCGFRMQTGYSPYRWRTEDGELHRRDNPVYKCNGRASGKLGCTGKSSYKQELIEGIVLEEIQSLMDKLESKDLSAEIEQIRKENTAVDVKNVKNLDMELKKVEKEIAGLKNEVVKAIMGESDFDKSMLNGIISEKEELQRKAMEELQQAEFVLKQKELDQSDLVELQNMIPVWRDVFENADLDEKRVMLSKLIERITVYRDEVVVEVSMTIKQFLKDDDFTPPPDGGGGGSPPDSDEDLTRNLLNMRPY